MKKGPRSLADVFAKQGNPWMTQKEARKDFQLNDVFDKPDLDQFTKATMARHDPAKVSMVRKVKRVEPDVRADPAKRMAAIVRRMNDALNKHPVNKREHRKSKNTDEPDFTPPAHHVGVDMFGRDLKTAKEAASKGKRRKRKSK